MRSVHELPYSENVILWIVYRNVHAWKTFASTGWLTTCSSWFGRSCKRQRKLSFYALPGLLSLQKETDSNGLRWFFSDFKCAGFVSFWRCTAIFQHVASSSCCKAQWSHWLRGDNLANMLTEEVILHSARLIQIPLMNHLWCFFSSLWPRLDVRNRESSRSHRARLLFFGVCWFRSLTLMNDSELHGWRHTWDCKLCRTCARQ